MERCLMIFMLYDLMRLISYRFKDLKPDDFKFFGMGIGG